MSQHYSIDAFTENMKRIKEHNSDPSKAFTMTVN